LKQTSKRVAVATLFGAVIFVSKTVLPSPVDKMFIVVHAALLALGALLLRRMGATYVAVVGGILTALWRSALAPFTFGFALLYGLLVDGLFLVFRVNTKGGEVNTRMVVAIMMVSTALTGFLSYYVTVFPFGLFQQNPAIDAAILAAGILSGMVAGYLASVIWNKRLKHVRF